MSCLGVEHLIWSVPGDSSPTAFLTPDAYVIIQPPPHSVDIICATVSSRQEAWVWSGHTGVP